MAGLVRGHGILLNAGNKLVPRGYVEALVFSCFCCNTNSWRCCRGW
ncbi:hypothetical protein KCP70_21715 [Salmonella enterica subsp. enterica]|nr:hypothetical protein KCP70_21715 [Salmonella enterica subsp. enterica]